MVNRLRGKIIEKGFTVSEVAKAMGINTVTFWRKCKGISGFTLKDIIAIRDFLALTNEELLFIFFTD